MLHIQVDPAAPLVANAGDSQIVTVNDDVHFDGSGSQPSAEIDSYAWDFGDGATGSGVDVSHAYNSPGSYTATLTVTGGGSTSTSTAAIIVNPVATVQGLLVTVTANGAPLAGAEAMVIQGNGQRVTGVADSNGVVTLAGLPDGAYTVYAYQPGYVPGTVSATVGGGSGSASISLSSGPVVSSTVTSTRLTYTQIVAAGINPDDPANQNVFKFTINLGFIGGGGGGDSPPAFEGYVCGDTFCGDTGWAGGAGAGYDYCSTAYCYSPSVQVVDNQPTLEWLIIPGTASFLKEFFQVQMVVNNLAPAAFTLSGGNASLQLPSGLSLAPTSSPQQLSQSVADIPGGGTATANWIVRGDTEGSYNLTADYSGVLQPFGDPVSIEATTATPLKVWGGSALTMTVDADATATADYPYEVRVGLTNVSDIPIYNPTIALAQAGGVGYIFQPLQQLSYSTDVILPGQTFYTPYYILIPQVSGTLDLSNSFVKQTGGNVDIASTIVTHPAIDPPGVAPTLTATPVLDGVGLTWDRVPGATSYQIYSTPTALTPFTTTPIQTIQDDGSASYTYIVNGVTPGSDQWLGISSVVNGVPTMLHPIVEGTASDHSTEPVTTVNAGSGCGAPVDATVQFNDGFSSLTSWTYTLGNNAPVTQTLTGRTGGGSVTVPLSDIPVGVGVTLTVQGSDTRGAGPTWTSTLGGYCSYVALGDSFASGEGAPDSASTDQTDFQSSSIYTPQFPWNPPNYDCHRSTLGYAYQLSQDFPTINLSLLAACSGAWTTDVDPNLSSLGGSPQPLKSEGYQLNAPQVEGADIVSVSAGGNDLGFAPVLGFCVTATSCENYFDLKGLLAGEDLVDVDISDIYPQLVQLYEDIAAAAPNAQVYVMDYPHLFDTSQVFTCDGIQPDEAAWFQAKQDEFDNAIGDAVNAAESSSGNRIHYVDVRNAFEASSPYSLDGLDHRLCGSAPNDVNGLTGNLPFHPNAYGQKVEESYLAAAIQKSPTDPYHQKITSLGAFSPLLETQSTTSAGVQGLLYTVVASGFDVFSAVTLSIFSNQVDLGTATTDGNGNLNTTVTIPPDLPEGSHTLVIQGTSPSGAPMTIYQPIDVTSPGPLAIQTSSLEDGEVGTAYPSTSLVASGGTLPLTWSITSGSLPSGMNLDANTGIIDGTPTAAGRSNFTVSVTDGEATPVTVSQSLSVTVTQSVNALAITTTSVPNATVGTAYPSTTLGASGGVTPETWSLTAGTLPPGISLDATTGELTGTATTGGTYAFTVGVTDSEPTPVTVTQALSITVAPAATTTAIAASAPTLTTAQSETYTATVTSPVAPGGTVDFTDGTSPITTCQNVALSTTAPYSASCTLSYSSPGTHTVAASYSGDVSTTDSTSTATTVTVTQSVNALAITTTSVPNATVGTAYPSTTLGASGGVTPETRSLTAGTLPPGISLDATTGELTGTATTGGTYAFTVGVTDSEPTPVTVTQALSITVAPAATTTAIAASAPTLTTAQSETYTATVTSPVAPGGTVDFTDGTSPITTCQNVALSTTAPYSASCTLSYSSPGTHTVAASYSGDVSTTDSTSTATTVTVTQSVNALAITTTSVPNATVGTAYPSTTLGASGGVTPETWSLTAGTLPPGISLDATTGELTGTATTGGTYAFTVGVTDSEPTPVTVTQALSITVAPAATTTAIAASAPTLTTAQSETYTATVTSPVAPGGTVDFTDGTSPITTCQNVALSTTAPYSASCTLSYSSPGTHTVAASYSGDVSTTDSTSTATTVTVTQSVNALAITTTSVPNATVGTAYPSTTLGASGGVTPETWSLTAGTLPPGISLDATTGELTGTATTGGTYAFTVGVTDSEPTPVTVTQALSITVAPAATTTAIAASAPTLTTAQSETYTATVTSPVAPGGTVDFTDGTSPITTCQNVALSTTAPYSASCTLSYSSPGTHTVAASYSGDVSTTDSTSTATTVTVTQSVNAAPADHQCVASSSCRRTALQFYRDDHRQPRTNSNFRSDVARVPPPASWNPRSNHREWDRHNLWHHTLARSFPHRNNCEEQIRQRNASIHARSRTRPEPTPVSSRFTLAGERVRKQSRKAVRPLRRR